VTATNVGSSVTSLSVSATTIPTTPSTPILQTIAGSYITLLLGNVDSKAGLTYYYTLNTQTAGTYTAISNLQKSGSGYIVTGLVPNQDYTIGITANNGNVYGPTSIYSDIVRTVSIPKPSTPTLQTIVGSATTLLLGNVDSTPGLTYYYRLNTDPIGTYTLISNLSSSGSGYILPNLVAKQDYSIGIVAKVGSAYGPESTYSTIIKTIPTPSKPTLSLISGSYTSLLLGNVDSTPGYTYSYRLNTDPLGQYTAISTLTPSLSGSGYILPNLLIYQNYTVK
jgi:hypothetical protein